MKQVKKIWQIVLLVCTLATIVACGEPDVYNSYVALPNAGWGQDSLAVFRADIANTNEAYDISFQIRNQSFYKYANLWLFVDVISPDGEMQRDTVECILANNDGSWRGAGWGSLYSLQCPYRLNTRFAKSGQYTFRVSHGMRDADIRGIHSLGLKISKNDGQE